MIRSILLKAVLRTCGCPDILFSIPANDFKNGDKLKIVINLVDKTGITSQIEKNFIVAIIDDSVSLYEE